MLGGDSFSSRRSLFPLAPVRHYLARYALLHCVISLRFRRKKE
jgi:hypothetical protein